MATANTPSELEKAGIGMVSQFPLDVMHLIDLGVTKCLISALLKRHCRGGEVIDVSRMAEKYEQYNDFKVQEFARTPRHLKNTPKFKATEWRQFVLYGGVVLLKEFLPPNLYEHFLRLSLAYRIVSSRHFHDSLDVAQALFEDFVKEFSSNYPHQGRGYNVHGLLHVVEDVKLYGPVDSYSAYKFENAIQQLANRIRKSSQVLQQMHNRLQEDQVAGIRQSCREFGWSLKGKNVVLLMDTITR